jgi:hypothetical protein
MILHFITDLWNRFKSLFRTVTTTKKLHLDDGNMLLVSINQYGRYLSIQDQNHDILVPTQRLICVENDGEDLRYSFENDYILTCSAMENDVSLIIEKKGSDLCFQKVQMCSDDIEQIEPLFVYQSELDARRS